MEALFAYFIELQTYWKSISFFGVLLVLEGLAKWRWSQYKLWASQSNRGVIVRLSIILIAVLVLGFFAFEGERRKNVAAAAVVIGQPGEVYNVDGRGSRISAYLAIVNHGESLANNVQWKVGVNILNVDAGNGSFEGLGTTQLTEGPENIGPNQMIVRHPEAGWPSDSQVRIATAKAIKAREKGIFVFGRIKFETMGELWVSTFCRIYAGSDIYYYKGQSDLSEAYPSHEYTPCPNSELNHGPRKIPISRR